MRHQWVYEDFITAPKTKFAKVMFSQVSVCPQGGLSLCPGGGSLSWGVSVQGGSLSGASLSRESVSSGVFVQGGLCHGDAPSTVMSRWYTSYWNVFLFQGCARFPEFLQYFSEHQIFWSLCSVVFLALTLKLPIQTSLSVSPELQVSLNPHEKCPNFRKTSTSQG